jgi:hypothetical protein
MEIRRLAYFDLAAGGAVHMNPPPVPDLPGGNHVISQVGILKREVGSGCQYRGESMKAKQEYATSSAALEAAYSFNVA